MLFFTVWAIWSHCDGGENGLKHIDQELLPTTDYFDENRRLPPIQDLKYVTAQDANGKPVPCADDDYEILEDLYVWPGTNEGCKTSGEILNIHCDDIHDEETLHVKTPV